MFLHIDLDCFFVSAAKLANPNLNSKIVAVAGGNCFDIFGDFLESGIIVSASYEARSMGINCGMHSKVAQNICPQIIIVKTDFKLYHRLSKRLFDLLLTCTNEIEKYSIDEFFIDLTGTKFNDEPIAFAKDLQKRVQDDLGLPCSIGLSDSKFIAKFATKIAKPAGIKLIGNINEIGDFEISKFVGIGKSATKFLNSHGIYKIKDVENAKHIFEKLGKNGLLLYLRLCGLSDEKTEPNKARKSLSMARTFKPIYDRNLIEKRILTLCRYVAFDIFSLNLHPSKFEIKFRYTNQHSINASTTKHCTFTQKNFDTIIKELFLVHDKFKKFSINYLSVGVGGFDANLQLSLFEAEEKRYDKIDKVLTKIHHKYGIEAIKSAAEI